MARDTNQQQANQSSAAPATSTTGRGQGTQGATGATGATGTTGAAGAAAERERGIRTTQESGARGQGTGVARRGGGGAVQGGGFGSPFTLMQRMADDMDRLFEQFGFGRSGLGLAPLGRSALDRDLFGTSPLAEEQALWSPQVELFQRGDRLVVRADLPGIRKEDVHVELENDVLTISGERREEQEENREGFYRTERRYGQFQRAIPLPEGVSGEQCEATYKDGVLEVTLPMPRQEERRGRKIEIR